MLKKSYGLVYTEIVKIFEPLILESGEVLPSYEIAYETYGRLDLEGKNAILICHGRSGNAHAAGHHESMSTNGWWDNMIGPGKAFDTRKFFVISTNILGGCGGSTGPSSINPDTGDPYGTSFPIITIKDMVNAQRKLLEYLGIKELFAVAGGSIGGMQVLQWTVSYPKMIRKAIVIACTASTTPQQIAIDFAARKSITSDPNWNEGDYYRGQKPIDGLAQAYMFSHIADLSDRSMYDKFGRSLHNKKELSYDLTVDFQVEDYLNRQALDFAERFDPNSFIYVTKAMDYFDLTGGGSLKIGLETVEASVLVISVTSDWLFPSYQGKRIVEALAENGVDVQYGEILSDYGHDAFLVEGKQLTFLVNRFLSHPSWDGKRRDEDGP
ncbi:MAG: homoserine O-acetyltransferase [Methanomassiliicoccales archaeon]|jgi:homoserine O-acetyltransferase